MIIFGDVGLGKTHLAQAIGNDVVKNSESKQVLYVTTEKFTNQVIQAIKSNALNDFMNFYQMIDVLIVDDIHFWPIDLKPRKYFLIFLTSYINRANRLYLLLTGHQRI